MSCCDDYCHVATADAGYRRILWAALGINVAIFLVEIVASFVAGSVSLRADALDFLGYACMVASARACSRRCVSPVARAPANSTRWCVVPRNLWKNRTG